MTYVDDQLSRGEKVIERIDHGRTPLHRLITAAEVIIGGGFLASLSVRLIAWALPTPATSTGQDPVTSALDLLLTVCLLSPAIFIGLASLATLVHVFWDDLALTDRRLIGRWQGNGPWHFRRVDLPLRQISDVHSLLSTLKIQRVRAKPLDLSNFPHAKEFAALLRQSVTKDKPNEIE